MAGNSGKTCPRLGYINMVENSIFPITLTILPGKSLTMHEARDAGLSWGWGKADGGGGHQCRPSRRVGRG